MGQALRGGVVGLAVLTGLMVVAVSPASADIVDGCTAVPDSGPVFDFTESCNEHDSCYIERPYGSSADARSRCDSEFRDAMAASCDSRYPRWTQAVQRGLCHGVAWMYYYGVRVFGGIFWEAGSPAAPMAG